MSNPEGATGYTVGPWRVGVRYNSVVADAPAPGIRGSDDVEEYGGHLIAESINESNACLIAAAPDLLEALEFVLSAHGEQLHTAFEAAQAAIAKARGK